MRKITWLHAILGALVVAAVTVGPVLADLLKELDGSLTGTFTQTLVHVYPPITSVRATVTGPISHLGRSTVELSGLGTVDAGGNPIPIPGTAAATITAADGDQIFTVFHWTANLSVPGIYALQGPFVVVGGTGRFEGATGDGAFGGQMNLVTGRAAGSMEGAISLPE
jgi:hypothetical protein